MGMAMMRDSLIVRGIRKLGLIWDICLLIGLVKAMFGLVMRTRVRLIGMLMRMDTSLT